MIRMISGEEADREPGWDTGEEEQEEARQALHTQEEDMVRSTEPEG
jgi:hypothetical protein